MDINGENPSAMTQLDVIQARLSEPLESMNALIRSTLHTSNELLNNVITDYLRTKGKQIRPLLVMLSAQLHGGMNDHVLAAAAALEMLHNASLIHDDVVDETRERRGRATINASWGNHIAVLVGDYFVSKALEVGLRTESVAVVRGLSSLGVELSTGEVDQICNARSHTFVEEAYLEMIRKKTASLFTHCILLGADTSGQPANEQMMRFADLLGLCFQIKDDIFDYFPSTGAIGKPTGNDLREGKVTLPLIHALQTAPAPEAARARLMLEQGIPDEAQIEHLVDFARRHGGIEYAFERMREMQREAMAILMQYPESEARRSFADIFGFIIDRNY